MTQNKNKMQERERREMRYGILYGVLGTLALLCFVFGIKILIKIWILGLC